MARRERNGSRASDIPATIGEFWADAVAAAAPSPPFLAETAAGWRPVGWSEAAAGVAELAGGFRALGVERGDHVAILSRTRLEWTLCDLALATLGAVSVPIYQTSSREECAHVLRDSGARFLVCEDAGQLAKTDGLERQLPLLERRLAIEPVEGVLTLAGLARRDEDGPVAGPGDSATPTDVLTVIYTSGTTGPPKGCVLTHANFATEIEAIGRVQGLFAPGDTILLFLPLAHNFARLIQYCAVRFGLTLAFCAEPARLPEALREVRPTTIPAVPRVFEKLHASIEAGFAAKRPVSRALARRAVAVGRRTAALEERRERVPRRLAAQRRVADALVFSKIRERLGGRVRLAISGGAPLARDLAEFFAACGVPVLEGYGLSETTSGCTVNRPDRYRFGTVGLPLPGVQVALAPDGEVIVRGGTVFRGYHGRPEATDAVLADDGWLRTGDLGAIDADGFLTITGRKKDLIVTAGGKKIAPQNVEYALTASPYVAQALVVGDRRPYVVALVSVDEEELAKAGVDGSEAERLVAEAVAAVNAELGRTEQIKRFAVLPRPFSIERGEVTPTLKLRRRICEEHFREEIEALYAGGRGNGG